MYKDFWKFSRRPFGTVPDAAFYFPAESHEDAIVKASYFLTETAEAVALVGKEGIGKTTIAARLAARLGEANTVVRIDGPALDEAGVLLALLIRLSPDETDVAELVRLGARGIYEQLLKILQRTAPSGRRVIVLADNVEMYSVEGLRAVFALKNLQGAGIGALAIMLLGSPAARKPIRSTPELHGRIGFWLGVNPLGAAETTRYIRHRLKTAGGEEDVFGPEAMKEVWNHTKGIPLYINRLCDLALLSAFGEERREVTAQDVAIAASELKI